MLILQPSAENAKIVASVELNWTIVPQPSLSYIPFLHLSPPVFCTAIVKLIRYNGKLVV
jgi:hypothetical protein